MKEKQILVVIKEPGRAPVVEPLFDNDLKMFQDRVGGPIETVTFASALVFVCNRDGRLQGLPFNCEVLSVDFVGTVLAVGAKGEEFVSIKAQYVPMVLKLLGG